MTGNNIENFTFGDLIALLKQFIRFLLKKWLALLLAIVIGIGIGATYYKLQKPEYIAASTFILEDKSSSGAGLAGLASQFGFNLSGITGGGGLFAGDNILEILKSKKVVQEVLLSKVDENSTHGASLADSYIEFSELKKKWRGKPELSAINFTNVKKEISPLQDSVLNVIYDRVLKNNLYIERVKKQGTIIKVQMSSESGTFSRLMTERLIEEASKLYLDIRIGSAQENIVKMQRRSDSLLHLLNNKTYRAAASQPLDINPGIKTAIVPVEIATRDKTVAATLYTEVTKNLEASKLILSQQTPVIQLLDRPSYLLDDNKLSLTVSIIVSSIIAFVISVIVLSLSFLYKIFSMGKLKKT